jgi:hypothetical protein
MQRTRNSGRRAINAKRIAEPNSGLHIEVSILVPVASNTPMIPYAARSVKGGVAKSSHFRYLINVSVLF